MSSQDQRKRPSALKISSPSRSSSTDSSSSNSSLKPPRTPRFAEATSINSPVEAKPTPFGRAQSVVAQPQPSDIGFGYIGGNNEARTRESATMPMTPRSPLKSALKSPNTPGRRAEGLLSPTFREEQMLDKTEKATEKEQARDLRIKARVRMAKFALRGISFSCSLIILSMLSASFAIFNSTKALAAQSNLPPWAPNTNTWPQKVVLAAACISLVMCVVIFVMYCRGGHTRAEKVGVYYTLFAVGWFIFSMVLWAAAAGILQFSRNNSDNKDMWGWACVENRRSDLFDDKVDYALVCRLQNWTLICIIIEIVIEVIAITLYSIVFYRYYTKRRLHKSMDVRDRARSDLYLAQLRSQSAPNTPGFGPKSPSFSTYALSPRFPPSSYKSLAEIDENPKEEPQSFNQQTLVEPQSQFARGTAKSSTTFKLQAPPSKAPSATPKMGQGSFKTPTSPKSPPFEMSPTWASSSAAPVAGTRENVIESAPTAPGEQQYAAVPIPGAYADAAVKGNAPGTAR